MWYRHKTKNTIIKAEQILSLSSPLSPLLGKAQEDGVLIFKADNVYFIHPSTLTQRSVHCGNYLAIDQKNTWALYTSHDMEADFIEHVDINGADKKHPLKNPDSPHYAMWHNGDGEAVESIDLMEKMFTPEELLTWAKITVLKYRLRIGKKDDIAKEMKKVETYEAYIAYLEHKIRIERMPKCTPEGMASMRRILDAEFEKNHAFLKAHEAKN